jgi:hypothetical protein
LSPFLLFYPVLGWLTTLIGEQPVDSVRFVA